MNEIDFSTVTELAGEEIPREQIQRVYNRYGWAASFCKGKKVLEIACGTGQGLGLLEQNSQFLVGGDFSAKILSQARGHYGSRIPLTRLDAQHLPFQRESFDVLIIFEAIYYLPDPDKFLEECQQVLTPNGRVLLVTANKDLPDFNPSPYSHQYFGVMELESLFSRHGFNIKCYGDTPVIMLSSTQKMLRLLKRFAVRFNLIPKTMAGKKILKRLVFGKLAPMPPEVKENMGQFIEPTPLDIDQPDRSHKVLFAVATVNIM